MVFFKGKSRKSGEAPAETGGQKKGTVGGKKIALCGKSQNKPDQQTADTVDQKSAQKEILKKRVEGPGDEIAHNASQSTTHKNKKSLLHTPKGINYTASLYSVSEVSRGKSLVMVPSENLRVGFLNLLPDPLTLKINRIALIASKTNKMLRNEVICRC